MQVAGGYNFVGWEWGPSADNWLGGMLREFDNTKARAVIDPYMQSMYNQGARRCVLTVEHLAGGNRYALDSTNGVLGGQDLTNCKNFFAQFAAMGYQHLFVDIGPVWTDDSTLTPRQLSKNFSWAMQLLDVLQASPIPQFSFGIGSEKINTTALSDNWLWYLRTFWQMTVRELGGVYPFLERGGAVLAGYSIIWTPAVVDNFLRIYDGVYPSAPWIHCYGDDPSAPDHGCAQTFTLTRDAFAAKGIQFPSYFVAETAADNQLVANFWNSRDDVWWWCFWPVGTSTASRIVQDRLPTKYLGR